LGGRGAYYLLWGEPGAVAGFGVVFGPLRCGVEGVRLFLGMGQSSTSE
jgi:hypothetical protein